MILLTSPIAVGQGYNRKGIGEMEEGKKRKK